MNIVLTSLLFDYDAPSTPPLNRMRPRRKLCLQNLSVLNFVMVPSWLAIRSVYCPTLKQLFIINPLNPEFLQSDMLNAGAIWFQ